MKITVTAAKIGAALALVASAARVNVKRPTLGAVRITATSAGEITFAATDLDTTVIATTAAEVLEPGQAAIPHDRFAALVTGFAPSAMLTISANDAGAAITPREGRATYRLPCLGFESLPDLQVIDTATGEIKIAATDFLRLLEPLAAASTEITRKFLCGVFLQSVGGKLNSTASDGARLMRTAVTAESFSEGRDLVIPASSITALRGLFTRTKPRLVTLRRSQRLFAIIAPDFQFTTKLIECGDTGFPETDHVIPQPAAKPVCCSRADLLAVLRRLAAVALTDQVATLATLSAADGQLSIALSRRPDDGLDHVAAGGDLGKIVVSIKQFAGLLDEFNDELIGLEAVSDEAPLVIRAENKLALVARSHWKDA